jgi:probable F420-dependent oxidoreductase
MKVETTIVAPTIPTIAESARRLEDAGYDSVVTPEAGHDPFLPLMVIAEHTQRLRFGTGVAIAFPRSPMVTAQIAWDLQRFSGGRFMLGLGTQVKGHNERRYSTPWPSPPGPRLKEYILCMKAIFKTFQQGARPDFQGKHYQFTLISPFFNPGPNEGDGHVPIYISAVNRYNCRLVGEVCDGIRMHAFNTAKYTEEVILPEIRAGAAKAGRKIEDIDLVGGAFIITGKNEEEVEKAKAPVRQQLSFYASTRAYHPVLETHGWDIGEQLFRLSMEGNWPAMAQAITDEMLEEFAIIGTYDELVPKIKERYAGVVTTLDFGFGVRSTEESEQLAHLVQELKKL